MLSDSRARLFAKSEASLSKKPELDAKKLQVAFSVSKKEQFTPTNNFKSIYKRLKSVHKVIVFKDEMTSSKLDEIDLLIFGSPQEKFSTTEFTALHAYIDRGGSIMYLANEGGESSSNTNLNYFLETFGIEVNAGYRLLKLDVVARDVFYKYLHPKEALITNGILNRELNRAAGKTMDKEYSKDLAFVYPFGATLNIQPPAIPVLSSGTISYPLNRPIGAIYQTSQHGKILVLGSANIFNDDYLDKEENIKVFDVMIQLLLTDTIVLNPIDATEPEVSDYHYLPDISRMSEKLRACLQDSEELPKDFTTLFEKKLFSFDCAHISGAIKLYAEMGLRHETLTLIKPQLECPLPPLQPAVFPPTLKDVLPPFLELFDLDETFSTEKTRLSKLTSKCSDEDLEFYIRECASIIGLTNKLPTEKQGDARFIFDAIFKSIVNWKKLN